MDTEALILQAQQLSERIKPNEITIEEIVAEVDEYRKSLLK